MKIDSFAVQLISEQTKNFAENLFYSLLNLEKPILGILREGHLLFDVMTIFEDEIPYIAESVSKIINSEIK